MAKRLPSRRRTSSSSAARSRAARAAAPTRRRAQNVARASRKDVRDAVQAARGAQPKWATATAYNRGQVLYRIAEMMEARLPPSSPRSAPARPRSSARSTAGSGTPASPTSSRRCSARRTRSPARTSTSRSRSRPASSAIVAPDEPPLLGLVSRLAPALTGGNAVVALASETQPLAAIELAEVIATSDVPAASSTCSPASARSSRRGSPRTWT